MFLAAFAAAFFPARTASAFKSLEALEPLGSLAGFCDVLGATGMAPAGPLVLAQDEATLIASALAAGISDPRGASMTAPLFVVELDSGAIAALDDLRCERASRALPNAPDDSKNAPDTAPPADVDPAVPAVALQLFAFQVEAPETIAPSATDAMLPGHPRDVEHPPRLSRRHP